MGSIYIEKRSVTLSAYIFDHMYLVYKDDNGDEFVIRGGPAGSWGNITVEVGVPMASSADNIGILSPEDRYQTEINLGGRNAEDVWNIMLQHAADINSHNIPYYLTTQNSNSTIASVLNVVGLDVNDFLPLTVGSPTVNSTDHLNSSDGSTDIILLSDTFSFYENNNIVSDNKMATSFSFYE